MLFTNITYIIGQKLKIPTICFIELTIQKNEDAATCDILTKTINFEPSSYESLVSPPFEI